jgi:hypothetical protein
VTAIPGPLPDGLAEDEHEQCDGEMYEPETPSMNCDKQHRGSREEAERVGVADDAGEPVVGEKTHVSRLLEAGPFGEGGVRIDDG